MDTSTWLQSSTILACHAGSRSYGTNRPDSDVDIKGVCIPPRDYRDGYLHNFAQADSREHLAWIVPLIDGEAREVAERDGLDGTIYGISKFFKLASDCNPNVIEALFVDDADVIVCSDLGQQLRDARRMFLSQKALHTFRGYAMSQLKRIKTHRRWLMDPPTSQPQRTDFGLPERTVIPKDQLMAVQAMIDKKIDSWEVDFGDLDDSEKVHIKQQIGEYLAEVTIGSDEKYAAAARLLDASDNFLDLLDRERRYKAAKGNWKQYNDWKKNRNVVRAELEARYGYDCKHAMHLVRLMTMCEEILTEGVFRVRRPDAEFLLSIRDGGWPYDELIEWADNMDTTLVEKARASALPRQPNRKALDALCQELTRSLHG